jgi:formylglycine-generating enzyme required for sulfatase activity
LASATPEEKVFPTDTAVPLPPTPTTEPTPTPGPTGEATEPAIPLTDLITISAGDFIMGSDTGDNDEKPRHTVNLPAFQIEKLEVTIAQYQVFVLATGHKMPPNWANGNSPEGKANHPVVFVSWEDARAYCEWAGRRLPTEAEWEKAARGADGRVYPWGNDWDPKKANAKESGIRGTTAVGSFPDGASPYGVLDMAGNVWEWVADFYQAYPGNKFQSPYFGEKFRVDRGGGWFSEKELLRGSNRSGSGVDLRNDDVGFRCAQNAP